MNIAWEVCSLPELGQTIPCAGGAAEWTSHWEWMNMWHGCVQMGAWFFAQLVVLAIDVKTETDEKIYINSGDLDIGHHNIPESQNEGEGDISIGGDGGPLGLKVS